jgi:trehalose 6-phosphate phosphatase
LSASIHYRVNSAPPTTRESLLNAIKSLPSASDAIITEGKMVIEVRPPLAVTKGTATLDLIQRHDLRGVVYLGDDLTDLDAFRSLHSWARECGGAGLAIAVLAENTPSIIREEADACLLGVPSAEALLQRLVSFLSSG